MHVPRALGSSGQVGSQLVDLRQGGRELPVHARHLVAQCGDLRSEGDKFGRARGGGHRRHVARMVV